MKYIIILSLIIFLCVGEINALNISAIKGKQNTRDFEFSKTILVNGVEFENGFLKMPLDGYKTKKYSNIKILSKDFYRKIFDCFKLKECTVNRNKKDVLTKVENIFPLKSPLRIANANVSFDDELIVVFGIVKEKKDENKIWISYPKDFEIKNEVFKNNLENLIKREFLKTLKDKIE